MASPTPYKIAVPEDQLKWINDRVRTTRLPPGKDLPEDELWKSWGLPPNYARKLQEFWVHKYDWRRVEKEINDELAQFTVPIRHNGEDVTIHFVHHQSKRQDAIPLLFVHGWPGSFLEVRHIIKLLTDPADDASPAYHVVAPSLPGFGFSSYPSKPCTMIDMAEINYQLMTTVLGYKNFIAQGGDWGSIIIRKIAIEHPDHCRAIHLNMLCAAPPSVFKGPLVIGRLIAAYLTGGKVAMTEYESKMFERMKWWMDFEAGYQAIQGTKPQTLAYGLTDSPFGMMCWLREKVNYLVDTDAGFEWTDEQSITWAMPYILNGSPGHGEIYMISPRGGDNTLVEQVVGKVIPKQVSFGASIFPKDVLFAPRWWCDVSVSQNITYWKEHTEGGHFPSIEVPSVLVADVREFTNNLSKELLDDLKNSSS
ncbi:epoxide hydrolase domain-containing protein [Xylariales sp. PMI_506]|nr:epoxide hydrolase domain-containing protein [Xylariales sp. PMI_506]